MASMNTRLNIEKLDGNIVQKHGGSKQVGLKQLGSKQVGFKQLGHKQGAQGDHEAEVFQVSNDNTAVAQRRLEDKQLEEKTNTDCLVKEQENVHLGGPRFEVPTLDEDAEYKVSLGSGNNHVLHINDCHHQQRLGATPIFTCDGEIYQVVRLGLKDDMDARSDVYVLSNGCKKCSEDSDGYYWESTPGIRDGNTLRCSQSSFTMKSLVQTWLNGALYNCRLEGSLSWDCDWKRILDNLIERLQTYVQVFNGILTTPWVDQSQGICYGALVKGGSRSEVPAQVEGAAYRY
ncbi:hypothetical protein Tco_0647901 [Tanacetum coccineum]